MLRRFQVIVRRYRLPILFLVMVFPGSQFLAGCYVCNPPESWCWIWVEPLVVIKENVEEMVEVKLVNPVKEDTLTSVKWRVTKYPDSRIVPPEAIRFDPPTGQKTWLMLTPPPQISSTPNGFAGKFPLTTLFFEAEYTVNHTSQDGSITPLPPVTTKSFVNIAAIEPALICSRYEFDNNSIGLVTQKANPLTGKANVIDHEFDATESIGTLTIGVVGGESSQPWDFSLNTAATWRDTLAVSSIEHLNDWSVKVVLTYRASQRLRSATTANIPLFVKATGKNSRFITDIVKVTVKYSTN